MRRFGSWWPIRRARFLSADEATRRLELVRTEEHSEARQKTSELVSDQQGRAFDSTGVGGRHAMEPDTDPKRVELQRFVRHLAQELGDAALANRYTGLVLVAEPRLLGELRAALPKHVTERLRGEIHKDLAGLDLPRLADRLVPELWPSA